MRTISVHNVQWPHKTHPKNSYGYQKNKKMSPLQIKRAQFQRPILQQKLFYIKKCFWTFPSVELTSFLDFGINCDTFKTVSLKTWSVEHWRCFPLFCKRSEKMKKTQNLMKPLLLTLKPNEHEMARKIGKHQMFLCRLPK